MTDRRPEILLGRDGTIIVDHGYVDSLNRVGFIEARPRRLPPSTEWLVGPSAEERGLV